MSTLTSSSMSRHASRGRRPTAQAMVEFALALPIFLLVIYGLLETGRLIFTFAAVTTASREAVRYASAWGRMNTAGDPQYRDCTGIRDAAKNVGFLLNLSDTNILISYDDETPRQTPPIVLTPYCSPGTPLESGLSLNSGDRVVVQVTAQYTLLLPLVPLSSKTISSGPTARTVMGVIDLTEP